MKDKFLYLVGVLVPTFCILGFVAFLGLLVFDFYTNRLTPVSVAYKVGVMILCLILIKLVDPIRKKYRQRMETDQYGQRRKQYQDLSKEERRRIDMENIARDEQALPTSELIGMTKKGSRTPDEDLNGLTGLDVVKEQVSLLKAEFASKAPGASGEGINICLLGNPGTGKTTVVSILCGYLYKFRKIKFNEYILVNGSSFATSPDPIRRTNLILAKAKGRLLFIDEAYALVYSQYGAQIITIILDDIEKHRSEMAFVIAGYKKEMQQLIRSNEGLASRLNTYLMFPDYTEEELDGIVQSMAAKKGYKVDEDAYQVFGYGFEYEKQRGVFANARSARKAVDQAVTRHAYRLSKHMTSRKMVIEADDVVIRTDVVDYLAGHE